MRNNSLYILIPILLLCNSCRKFTSAQEEILISVSRTIYEEQKNILSDADKKEWKFRKEIYDNGSKPADKDVEYSFYSLNKPIDRLLEQVDTLLHRKDIQESDIVLLEDSIKQLEVKFLEVIKQKNIYKAPELSMKEIRECVIMLKERGNLNSESGKFCLLGLKNKLMVWNNNLASESYKMVASSGMYFKRVIILTEPESEIVEEGSFYKAKLFWGGSYMSSIGWINKETVKIKVNNQLLSQELNNGYKYSCKAVADKYDENGLCKKQLHGSYTYWNNELMHDTTVTFTRDYYVKKPCK